MPIMPRTEDKAKKIAYKIIGTPSNLRTDKSGTGKPGKKKARKKEK